MVQFNALREAQRPGLTWSTASSTSAWASHGDNGPYHGWMVGVSAYSTGTPNLTLKGVLNTTPNGGLGGIWQAGGEITFDGTYFYFETGNGTFDGSNGTGTGSNPTAPAPGPITGLNNAGFPINGDYGDSFVKVALDPTTTADQPEPRRPGSATETAHSNGWGIKVVDYFTPFNQNWLNATDQDVGSSAAVVVPDYNPSGAANQFASAAQPHLLVGSGKEGVIYLMNRDGTRGEPGRARLHGHGRVWQDQPSSRTSANELSGSLDSAALFNGQMYYVEGYGGVGKTFTFANGGFRRHADDHVRRPVRVRRLHADHLGQRRGPTASSGTWTAAPTSCGPTAPIRTRPSFTPAPRRRTAATPWGRPSRSRCRPWPTAGCTSGPAPAIRTTCWTSTACSPPPTGAPNDPSGLIAQADRPATQINLVVDRQLASRRTSPTASTSRSRRTARPTGRRSPTVTGTNPGYLSTGLTADTTYYFRVRAHDSLGFRGTRTRPAATTPAGGPHAIDYSAGFTTANTTPTASQGGLAFNGGTQAELVPGNNRLQLTSSASNQDRSVYFTNPQADPATPGKQDIVVVQHDVHLQHERRQRQPGRRHHLRHPEHRADGPGRGGRGRSATPESVPSFAFAINVYGGNAARHRDSSPTASSTKTSPRRTSTPSLENTPITVTISYAAGVVYGHGAADDQRVVADGHEVDWRSTCRPCSGPITPTSALPAATGGANSTQEITELDVRPGPRARRRRRTWRRP